jgi:hypothetical protein
MKNNNKLEKICPSCSHDSELVFNQVLDIEIDIKIRQCIHCKLFFDDSRIAESTLHKFISEEYYKTKDVGFSIDQRFIRHFTRRAKIHIKLILKYFPAGFKGNVLDVGCGAGFFCMKLIK